MIVVKIEWTFLTQRLKIYLIFNLALTQEAGCSCTNTCFSLHIVRDNSTRRQGIKLRLDRVPDLWSRKKNKRDHQPVNLRIVT